MLNSIRFEFYNNFDIWYDLYQENGGDPNYFINIIMCISGIEHKYGRTIKYGNGYGFGYACINEFGYGNGFGFGYGNGFGFRYGIGSGFRYENIIINAYGNFYKNGDGIL